MYFSFTLLLPVSSSILLASEGLSKVAKRSGRTKNAHQYGRFTWRYLLKHWQHFVHHVPPVEVFQDLPKTHQAVDSHLSIKTPVT